MAWTNSKIFSAYITDALNNTAALDNNLDGFKAALYDNDITPDQTVATANTLYNAGQWASAGNEVIDASGWPAGGRPLAGVASGFAANVYTFDANDTASANSTTTLTSTYGCLVYNDSTGDQGFTFNYFGGANAVTNGTFTVVWNASGIAALTL